MASTAQCRDISKLNKLVRVQLELALFDLQQQGVNPLVVETIRTKERQKWLYAQGRTVAQCKAVGIPVSYVHSGPVVTSTLNSIHITGFAVDVVPQRKVNGKMVAIWDANDKDTKKIIKTMAKYGFEPGANWTSFKDSPHYQVKGVKGTTYGQYNTTKWVTTAVQLALNEAIDAGLKVDGIWGPATTAAVNKFRKKMGWTQTGKLGTKALKMLLKYLK